MLSLAAWAGHWHRLIVRRCVRRTSTFLRPFAPQALPRLIARMDALTPPRAVLRPTLAGMNSVLVLAAASLITAPSLPTIPSPTIDGVPHTGWGVRRFGLGPIVVPQASPFPSRLAHRRRPNRVRWFVPVWNALRTGRSRCIALHLVLPRRSYVSVSHHSSQQESGLAPLQLGTLSGALGARRCRARRPPPV